MVILIGNQKGGAGKSTLTLLLANFLTLVKQRNVLVIDMDHQQSVAQKYEKSKITDNALPYEVMAADLSDYPSMHELLNATATNQVVLIDLPGKLDDDGLIKIFQAAHWVICPFGYDELSFESTIFFSVVLQKLNPRAMITYIPNRVKANVRYELRQDVDEQLNNFGQVTEPLPDRIDFQRVSTFHTPQSLDPVVGPVFEQLYHDYIQPL